MFGIDFSLNDYALSIGSDRIVLARGSDGNAVRTSNFVAVKDRRLVAIGDEALKLAASGTNGVVVSRFTHQGGFNDISLASHFLREAMSLGPRFRLLPPRVIVACAKNAKFSIVGAMEGTRSNRGAGVRKAITVPMSMAAILGGGTDISGPSLKFSFFLDHDWCAFGAIAKNNFVASFEISGGVDQLLEDFAGQMLAAEGILSDSDELHRRFVTDGLLESEIRLAESVVERSGARLEAQRSLTRNCALFALRLKWHYQLAMKTVAPSFGSGGEAPSLCFTGPYADVPRVSALVSLAFGMPVYVPEEPELAPVRGTQLVLADLKALLRGRSSNSPKPGR